MAEADLKGLLGLQVTNPVACPFNEGTTASILRMMKTPKEAICQTAHNVFSPAGRDKHGRKYFREIQSYCTMVGSPQKQLNGPSLEVP